MSAFTDELRSIKRLNFTGALFAPLKTTQNTVITTGVVVVLDPSSAIPAAPFFSYWHRFSNSKLEFTAELPSNYLANNSNSAVPFVNFSISFLPFLKTLKWSKNEVQEISIIQHLVDSSISSKVEDGKVSFVNKCTQTTKMLTRMEKMGFEI
ncbi:hypothetical protein ACJVDH_06810 [Pedobacter sp. AW1-32]|uniref:hypothetical protein n=1 Tax=Pedobacter sp. AW1-32 TaxID=3383026 RepID=UPI003FEE9756